MIPLEQQVVSLKLARRLKELGVKQESVFYWCDSPFDTWDVQVGRGGHSKCFSAFTVAELGSLLPPGTISFFDPVNDWQCKTFKTKKHIKREWSEADARARMLIWLIEKGELSSWTSTP